MREGFLGHGWHFPVTIDTEGRIVMSGGEEKIRQSLFIILSTSPGERVMLPDFGCAIHERVFTHVESATLGLLIDDVTQALARWEPRVDVREVRIEPAPRDPAVLLIDVSYVVRATNSRFNLVYPFYVS
ncbi:GPW/gp25 family protein [Archangium primigenium]|uniref:GPW/gp25 family protein n=1 Tax=[Archangium] primigenium TaxID=2792470 RepID=UPI00195917D2|nr:GPW/gp25 family protein [Archangium primigenium]MBM7116695.1 GPW/gp25 family protein [Archangium primigenium]